MCFMKTLQQKQTDVEKEAARIQRNELNERQKERQTLKGDTRKEKTV